MFVAVVDGGSFVAASQRLNTTQSSISQQIRKLEERYGARLLSRSRSGTTPTPAGERLYRRAVSMLSEAAAAEAELRAAGATRIDGQARVGLMSAMTRCILGPALRDFRAVNLNARVDIVEGVSNQLVAQVVSDELDAAVVPVHEVPRSVACRFICTSPEIHVSRKDATLHLAPIDLARDGPLHFVLPASGSLRRPKILGHLAACGVDLEDAIEIDSVFATFEFVSHSDYGAILPAMMVLPEIDSGELCVRPLAVMPLHLDLMLISSRRRAPSPVVSIFIERLEAELSAVHARLAAR